MLKNVLITKILLCLIIVLFTMQAFGASLTSESINSGPRVDVRTFGATGDGSTLDRQAIIKAQNSISSGVVFFPKGTYIIWGIPLKSNITYIGDGATLDIGLANPSGSAGIIIDTIENVTLIGFHFEGRRSRVQGVRGDGAAIGALIRGAKNVTLRDCTFTNWYTDGITISSNDAGVVSTNIKLIDCISTNSRRNNLSIVHADSVAIEGGEYNEAHGTSPQAGIDIEPDSNICRNITINRVKVLGNAGVGIAITGNKPNIAENVTVSGCVAGSGEVVVNVGDAKGKINITNNSGGVIKHWNYSGSYNNIEMDLVIDGNNLDGTSTAIGQQASILVQSGKSVKIWNNTIKNSQQSAIKVDMANIHDIELVGNKSYTSNRVNRGHPAYAFINVAKEKHPRISNNLTENLNNGVELSVSPR